MTVNKIELNELSTVAKSIKDLKVNHSNIYFSNGIVVTISTGRSFFANFAKNTMGELIIKFVETNYSINKADKSIAI